MHNLHCNQAHCKSIYKRTIVFTFNWCQVFFVCLRITNSDDKPVLQLYMSFLHDRYVVSCRVAVFWLRMTVQTTQLLAGLPQSMVCTDKVYVKYACKAKTWRSRIFSGMLHTSRKTSTAKPKQLMRQNKQQHKHICSNFHILFLFK